MKIGILKEILEGETRVAMYPVSVAGLAKKKHEVIIETGAGLFSGVTDDVYVKHGATIVKSAKEVCDAADIVFKVQPPMKTASGHEVDLFREGQALISYMAPFQNKETIALLQKRKVTVFAMEFVPRISRAQSMDSLSSQAALAGYKAVVMAADNTLKIFPMLTTAAGTIAPSTALILGAGVAGLQAIATAKRLGAKVEAFDPRPVVKEQVESLGATFIAMEQMEDAQTAGGYAKEQSDEFLRKEREAIAGRLPKADVVISTAQIFGKAAPVLITEDMVKLMQYGSVIVDLAASETGGNTELSKWGETVEKHGVKIMSPKNLAASLPLNASHMYSKNLCTLFDCMYGKETTPNFEDDVTKGACITHGGEIVNGLVKNIMGS